MSILGMYVFVRNILKWCRTHFAAVHNSKLSKTCFFSSGLILGNPGIRNTLDENARINITPQISVLL